MSNVFFHRLLLPSADLVRKYYQRTEFLQKVRIDSVVLFKFIGGCTYLVWTAECRWL